MIDVLKDYSVLDRKIELNNIVLEKSDIKLINYTGGYNQDYIGLEFYISPAIKSFCYNLARWKYNYVIDKPGLPYRSPEERLYDIFVGSLSECVMYLYLKYLGLQISELSYYDVVRNSPEYNSKEEYDLAILGEKMSIKCYANEVSFENNYIPNSKCLQCDITACRENRRHDEIMNVYKERFSWKCQQRSIHGTYKSNDFYYTQFVIPVNSGDINNKIYTFTDCLAFDKPLWLLGGVIKQNAIWNGYQLINNKMYDTESYISQIFKHINKPFNGLI